MSKQRWNPGDQIMYRGLWKGFIWWAIPATVIQDSPELIALYWPAGTPCKRTKKRATARDVFLNPKPILSDSYWTDTDILMLCRESEAYSINAMRSAEKGELLWWYVNLQAPLHRMEVGFETEDYLLDIVFEPDLSGWKLKDEDELAEAVELGIYTEQKMHEIYVAADEAVQSITSGTSPISKMWSAWRPPKQWGVAEMPENWAADASDPYRR